MRPNQCDQLILAAQAHGLYLRLRERLVMNGHLEPVAHHAYRRYQRRLSASYKH